MTDTLVDATVRRTADVILSTAALVVLSPVMALIAVKVRRDSPGPAIFKQQRVGRYGKPFTIYKFRTMRAGASGASVTASGDDRVTNVGRKLRSTKLDELPQLVNVLVGDMSIVGPRPEVPRFASKWPAPDRRHILTVRPGLTDPVTLELRDEAELLSTQPDPENFYLDSLLPYKAHAYARYVEERTLGTDASTLLKTAWALWLRG